ncbi:SWIM-type domain-containing protein [Durusdinium trenchii]|uniref:SWIM-type domain-containing protein n=1 Tax=Durusdinium trenchii TaxID=1381693 RepID=A0ABP0PQW5_9DINO
MRGYQQAQGGREGCARQPLPADCPICFEEIVEGKGVDFCRVCGHNVHCDCQQRWASAGKSDTCPWLWCK